MRFVPDVASHARAVVLLSACAALWAVGTASGCRNVSERSDSHAAVGDSSVGVPPAVTRSRLESAAALASSPEEKARAHLGLGNLALAQGEPREALRHFYEARQVHREGEIGRQTDAGIGLAYLQTGDYALSSRYLQKGLSGSSDEERELTLARLVVVSRALGDKESAIAFRSRLRTPFSPEVERVLATHPSAARSAAGDGAAAAVPGAVANPDRSVEKLLPPTSKATLRVLPRELWGARSVGGNIYRMSKIDKITVHHTAGPSFWGITGADAAAEIRNIQRFHQKQRGWADIGYHYIVDRAGNVWQGRKLMYQGAHARGDLNRGNIGIALLGNFCNQRPTAAQYRSLAILIEKICEHFGFGPERVFTHGELAEGKTSCPGPALTRCVAVIRQDLRRKLVAYRPSAAAGR